MGRVVTRQRTARLGSLRKAQTATNISVGTWQRIEHGEEFEYPSLVKVCEHLWDDGAAADDLLAGREPGARGDAVDTHVINTPLSEDAIVVELHLLRRELADLRAELRNGRPNGGEG
jgi:hypothetical protein